MVGADVVGVAVAAEIDIESNISGAAARAIGETDGEPHTEPECGMIAMFADTTTDDLRWQTIVDKRPDATFFYAVRTTGVFCRTDCPARLPRRSNVEFFPSTLLAIKSGYRACRRCNPVGQSIDERQRESVMHACRIIESTAGPINLARLARSVGLSRFHLHRLFKSVIGLTPKAYSAFHQSRRLQQQLANGTPILEASRQAGSVSTLYSNATQATGMTPSAFRHKGRGQRIRYAIGDCTFGKVLVACTEKGVCALSLGDEPTPLIDELRERFTAAELIAGDPELTDILAQVIQFVDDPVRDLSVPLDVRGTLFQVRVWSALRELPAGTSITYAELAQRIGHPSAIRAVATACAANPVAIAVPCHRVIRQDGNLAGYRWGLARKRKLLARERGQE